MTLVARKQRVRLASGESFDGYALNGISPGPEVRAVQGRWCNQFGTRRGALTGLEATGGVITSAGLVLAGTFAVLATLPVVSFAEVGFAVALGVLLDTLIVRSVPVTALNLDVGRHMWWPSKLAKEAVQGELPRRRTDAREGAISGSEKRDRKR